MTRTKIVATMGPAVADRSTLSALLDAGVDVCRLNFSHGTPPEHSAMLANIREVAAELGRPIATLGDLGGPKIRLGEVADVDGSGGMPIEAGQELILARDPIVGRGGVVSSTWPGIVDEVVPGERVLIEDGLLRFICMDKSRDALVLQCTAGGVLKSRKGINLPNTHLSLPSLTERDRQYLQWAIDNALDYIALSFVRKAKDLLELRGLLEAGGSRAAIIAKIEKAEAIVDIDAIIAAADGLMVARGDLGVEMDLAQVPIIQKELIRACRRAGKPVIVATQMLQSMIESSSPTRAEVSDVANAIFDGADAVMLSGETSVGRFPVGAVHTMGHVADATEAYMAQRRLHHEAPPPDSDDPLPLGAATARAVRRLAEEIRCKLVVVYSRTGETARLFARQRFSVPVVALCDDAVTLRQLNLFYGVLPIAMPMPADAAELLGQADACLRERKLAAVGETIVLVAGRALGAPGSMNGILVHTVGAAREGA